MNGIAPRLHYHLIGIGGAGMSAIAQILHDRGEIVTGSDRQENDAVRRLRAAGIPISVGHGAENVTGADVVVYSAAIPADNPEMIAARSRGVQLLERPAMLGRLIEPYKHRIAVSGTHGKTTTTAMISAILDRAGMDATVLIGGDVAALGGNARLGGGEIVVTEACEAFASFLHLRPSIAVITNIDADHLDHYGTVERIEECFRQFVSQVDADGTVVACWDDARVRKVVGGIGREIISYGCLDKPAVLADRVDVSGPEPSYSLIHRGEPVGRVCLGVPGVHNVLDSLAAASVGLVLNVGFESIQSALADFRGAVRRFEILHAGEVMVVDDYAHHPAEIAATLNAARSAYGRRIIAVFQPHLYSRTKAFAGDFAEALSLADEVVVTAVYAAREQPTQGIGGESIVELMRSKGFAGVRYEPDEDALPEQLAVNARSGDVVLILGAGDIREVGERLAALLSAGTGGHSQ